MNPPQREHPSQGRVIHLVPPLDAPDSPAPASPAPVSGPAVPLPDLRGLPGESAQTEPPERTLGAVGCSLKHLRWWRAKGHGHWTCEVCHPPVSERIVAERRTTKRGQPERIALDKVAHELR